MVSIINYNNECSRKIAEFLRLANVEHVLLSDEALICKSDTIIIPDCEDVTKAIRKLQLLNLSNVLKIINRKIIGINNGMFVMCSNFVGQGYSGLGLFDSDVYTFGEDVEVELDSFTIINSKSICKKYDFNINKFKYKSSRYVLPGENTCIKANAKDREISVLEMKGKYIGINLSFQSDNEADKELLLKILEE